MKGRQKAVMVIVHSFNTIWTINQKLIYTTYGDRGACNVVWASLPLHASPYIRLLSNMYYMSYNLCSLCFSTTKNITIV